MKHRNDNLGSRIFGSCRKGITSKSCSRTRKCGATTDNRTSRTKKEGTRTMKTNTRTRNGNYITIKSSDRTRNGGAGTAKLQSRTRNTGARSGNRQDRTRKCGSGTAKGADRIRKRKYRTVKRYDRTRKCCSRTGKCNDRTRKDNRICRGNRCNRTRKLTARMAGPCRRTRNTCGLSGGSKGTEAERDVNVNGSTSGEGGTFRILSSKHSCFLNMNNCSKAGPRRSGSLGALLRRVLRALGVRWEL